MFTYFPVLFGIVLIKAAYSKSIGGDRTVKFTGSIKFRSISGQFHAKFNPASRLAAIL